MSPNRNPGCKLGCGFFIGVFLCFQHREKRLRETRSFFDTDFTDCADHEIKRLRRDGTNYTPQLCAFCASFVAFVDNLPMFNQRCEGRRETMQEVCIPERQRRICLCCCNDGTFSNGEIRPPGVLQFEYTAYYVLRLIKSRFLFKPLYFVRFTAECLNTR